MNNNFDSFKEIVRFFDDVSALVDDIFNEEVSAIENKTYFEPTTDLFESNNKIFLFMEIPGVKKENLSIAVGPTMVIVQGIKNQNPLTTQTATYYNLEIPYGNFHKRIFLPSRIVAKSVRVSLKDGLLAMEFAKDEKILRVIKIE